MRRGSHLLGMVLVFLAGPGSGVAQQVRTAVEPDTVLAGDIFRVAIRIDLPPGFRAVLPDSLPIAGDLENAGRATRAADVQPDGGTRLTAVYPVSAWRPGGAALPPLAVVVEGPGGARELPATFPAVMVRSVLPPDTAGVDPRPPKDVLGASRLIWPLLLAFLAALAAAAVLVYLYRRRRRPMAFTVAAAESPRERALQALDRVRAAGLAEAGEFKPFYSWIADALREFLEEVDPAWSADRTTPEILDRVASTLGNDAVAALAGILESADLVKFARYRPTPAEALETWTAARGWVDAFRLPMPEPAVEEPVAESVPAVAGAQEVA